MELSSLANNYSLTAKRSHKYSTEQLAEIEHLFSLFDVNHLLEQKTFDHEDLCMGFFGSEKLTIQMTSAHLMYNMRQKHVGRVLTFDMRSRAAYH